MRKKTCLVWVCVCTGGYIYTIFFPSQLKNLKRFLKIEKVYKYVRNVIPYCVCSGSL